MDPITIAIFSKKRSEEEGEQKTNYNVNESVGIATVFLIQALHHAGLGALTHTPKPMSFLSKVCGRDNSNERPYMLIIVGYPIEDARVTEHAMQKKPVGSTNWLNKNRQPILGLDMSLKLEFKSWL